MKKSDVSQSEPRGNTKNPVANDPNKRVRNSNQLYRWCFTLKAESATVSQMSQLLQEFAKEFYFQQEKSESGYDHWQGCLSLKQKQRFSTVKNLFPNDIHLEACKNWWKSIKYCQKEETRILGPFSHKTPIVTDMDITKDNMYPWQKEIFNICKQKPDKRKIYWYWEPVGNVGKSEFCKYMYLNEDVAFFTNAKTADIAYSYNGEKVCMFDLPRTTEDRFNFNALEQLKNGMLFSSKYESGAKVFNRPHIIIFANWKPPTQPYLSKDRLIVKRLSAHCPPLGGGRGESEDGFI